MNNINLPLPSPDFDSLKNSLKDFMSTYEGLTDYDYSGSTISILLDTLAYNSHLNAFWLNMIGNEAFLKTAIKRGNVVAAARDLGYTPKSAQSAKTTLYMEVTPKPDITPEEYITLPAGSSFTASNDSASYSFNTLDDIRIDYNYSSGKYISDEVKIYEGRLLVHEWTVVSEIIPGEPNTLDDVTLTGFVIPNLSVDSSTMRVYVSDTDLANEFIQFTKYDGGVNIRENSNVFFLSENEMGLLNVTFGDGNLGYKPGVGAKIKVVYMIASGPGANNIVSFSSSSFAQNSTVTKITALHASGGGAHAETIESIKYNAQLNYESQGKAVVTGDYEYLVKDIYPNAKKVITWGGQDSVPPQYGKVFIAIQVYDGLILTNKDKRDIIAKLKKKNITTVMPVIVDPDYIYIDLDITLNWAKNANISDIIENKVLARVKDYAKNTLNNFDKNLEYSRLLSVIDDSSIEIVSNNTTITLMKRLNIVNSKQKEFSINFGAPLVEGSITSTPFSYSSFDNCIFTTRGNKLQITAMTNIGGKITNSVIVSNVGDIDYDTGNILLKNLEINSDNLFFDNVNNSYYLKIFAKPVSNDIITTRNQILNIDNIKVN